MRVLRIAVYALLIAPLAIASVSAKAERRVALVIGNSHYAGTSPLTNPANDAELMTKTLEASGFEVTKVIDADQASMKRAMLEFGRKLRDGADASLFFYAGHGVQANGENYLIPVDAAINDEGELDLQAVDVNAFLRVMQNSASKVNIVVLDACRNNPFASAFRSGSRGLAMVDAPRGTYIAYSTAPGEVAADGDSGNSPYTLALSQAIAEPGKKLEDTFKSARRIVLEATADQQVPWETSSITGDFFFRPAAASDTGLSPISPGTDQETAFWNTIKGSSTAADFEAYLKQFPKGAFAPLAEIRLAALTPRDKPGPAPSQSVDCEGGLVASVGDAGVADAAKRCLKPGDAFRDLANGPEMVVAPAGSFTMGSPKDEEGHGGEEGPQHEVTIIKPSAVGKFEVTRGEFAAFVQATGHKTGSSCWVWNGTNWKDTKGKSWRDPGYKQSDDHPVACISHEDAKAYVTWLSKDTGKDYRLLSEAEWEYAARGQTEPGDYPRFSFGNDEGDLCDHGNGADKSTSFDWRNKACSDGVGNAASPVGHYEPNKFGLHDMIGNVWEWVEDCYQDSYRGAPDNGSALTSASCEYRVLRGGAWNYDPAGLRAANRGRGEPDSRNNNVGFRVARTL